ncbi:peroxide stress protein YaaA [Candidatus Poribacteria bacterium]|nr:MAG: peroxide stress protein YaaA [Candidatus Poribacteria bacterium]
MKNYLLLISCSQRKITSEAPLPAIERYDGPVYRCLRKYRDTFGGFPDNLDILIISALYRLIECRDLICNYDERMTDQRAAKLLPQVQELLQWYVNYHKYDQVFINLGKTYMQTLDGFHWGTTPTMEASGGIGLKTQQMKAWLERITSATGKISDL